jgi:hypothetical protein
MSGQNQKRGQPWPTGHLIKRPLRLAEKVVPGRATSAVRWPMDLQTWISIFYDTFHMDVLDSRLVNKKKQALNIFKFSWPAG